MEALTLTAADVTRLEACMRALLTPLDHADVDNWRSSVNRAVGELLGAATVSFQLPAGPGREVFFCEDASVRDLRRRYLPLLDELDPKFKDKAFRGTVGLGVCTRKTLWAGELDEYFASEYYNEFVVPARALDMVCAATPLEGLEVPATLLFHRDDPRATPFGEREVALLTILFPAFVSGVRTFHRLNQGRDELANALDVIGDPVLVFDADGHLEHRNIGFDSLALGEDQERSVGECARELARGLAALWRARRLRSAAETPSAVRRVALGSRFFVLEASTLHWRVASSSSPSVLVVVSERTAPVKGRAEGGAEEGTRRLGLTAREAEVAELLAQRLTNREVAERLGISVHTARRHVERVRGKLGVRSRREVARALRE